MDARDIQRLQEQTARLTPDQRARIVDAFARALIAELRETGALPSADESNPSRPSPQTDDPSACRER